MPEDVARFTMLLEDIQTQVRVIADGHVGLTERMDRMDARFGRLEAKVDHLDVTVGALATKVDGLEIKVGGLQTKFEGFASETRLRLERIEGHLALAGPRRGAGPLGLRHRGAARRRQSRAEQRQATRSSRSRLAPRSSGRASPR